jgi:hypothetical protein
LWRVENTPPDRPKNDADRLALRGGHWQGLAIARASDRGEVADMKRGRGRTVEEEPRSQSSGSNSEGIPRNRKRRTDDRLLAFLIGCEEKIPILPIAEGHLKDCLDCILPSAEEHKWCWDEIGEMVTFLRFANDCPDALRFS